jgi:hypothetical protein
VQHRELVDREVLLARTEMVTVIVDAMKHDPAWKNDGDLIPRKAARRIAFAMWRLDGGGQFAQRREPRQ